MKALKLKIYQETACYRKPFAMKISETYPLPPYSTVNGLLHKLLGAEERIPFGISIQGSFESIINNYQTTYFYKKDKVTTMPMNGHMLLGVNLIIHVSGKEAVLHELYECFSHLSEFISLGRKEDLARIDEVSFVEVKDFKIDTDIEEIEEGVREAYTLKYPVYIPRHELEDEEITGINYRLCCAYETEGNKRKWDKIDVLYVEEGSQINEGRVFVDDSRDEDLVCFNY